MLLAFILVAVPGVFAASYVTAGSGRASNKQPPVGTSSVTVTTASANVPQVASLAVTSAFHSALELGLAKAEHEGGHAEAAIWADNWPQPIVVGDRDQMRLWSTAKPPTALAVMAAARAARKPLYPQFETWMERAFERSENCPEREMVLYLQSLAGSPLGAVNAFQNILGQARAHANVQPIPQPPDGSACEVTPPPWLGVLRFPLTNDALQFGTATWTIGDAIAFAHALAIGTYGNDGRRVLALMAKPKLPSLEQSKGEFTAPYEWGAGHAFSGWKPMYKAGWGGRQHGNFMVVQYVVLLFRGHKIAIAAAFHPNQQPTKDDPGEVNAWLALEDIFLPLRTAIAHAYRAH